MIMTGQAVASQSRVNDVPVSNYLFEAKLIFFCSTHEDLKWRGVTPTECNRQYHL